MSTKVTHTMTVTDTTSSTTSTSGKLACNIKVVKTRNALLKLAEVILGVVLIVVFFQASGFVEQKFSYALLAFLLCLLSTIVAAFLLLLSYVISPMAAEILPKSFFELLNNVYSALFFTCASLALLLIFSTGEWEDDEMTRKAIALIVLGFGNGALYFASSYYSYDAFKSS